MDEEVQLTMNHFVKLKKFFQEVHAYVEEGQIFTSLFVNGMASSLQLRSHMLCYQDKSVLIP